MARKATRRRFLESVGLAGAALGYFATMSA